MHVQRTVSDRRRVEPVKDGEPRRVTLSPVLLDAFRQHHEAMMLEGQVRQWSADQRNIAFLTVAGSRCAYGYFTTVWRALLAQAGLPRRKYHATRHSYATILLESGADLRFVQRQLGHSTIAMTADTYGHVELDRHARAVDALDRCLVAAPARPQAPPRPDDGAERVDSTDGG